MARRAVKASRAEGGTAPFTPLVPGIRWASLAVGLLLAAFEGDEAAASLAWGFVLVGHAMWRAGQRSGSGGAISGPMPLSIAVEAVVSSVVVGATGGWSSSYVFALLPAVVAAGFAGGFPLALRTAGATILFVAIPFHLARPLGADALRATGQWTVELLLVASLAGYLRRLFGEAEERHSEALDRMAQLKEANDLLVSLHRLAQSLPASLDMEQVLTSTLARLQALIDSDVAAVLVRDDVTGRWTVGASDGATLTKSVETGQLPSPLRAAAGSSVASLVVSLAPGEALGPPSLSRSGLYAPLRARGALIGLVALEHHDPGHYDRRALRLLDGFVGPAALALDNAGWFARLRAMGADEERTRIARDMHDSVGQSLAYLAFKLDRITKMATDDPLRQELDVLRGEVRGVLTEVRDALSDLRTDVTEQRGLVETLEGFLDRVRGRTELEVTFTHQDDVRLPLLQERELWRIAHEAISNVERHARATHLRVRWQCDGQSARLTVADDGKGFSMGRAERSDRYGIKGMKERAGVIGARLIVESEPFVGTLVECRLNAAPRENGGDPVEAA